MRSLKLKSPIPRGLNKDERDIFAFIESQASELIASPFVKNRAHLLSVFAEEGIEFTADTESISLQYEKKTIRFSGRKFQEKTDYEEIRRDTAAIRSDQSHQREERVASLEIRLAKLKSERERRLQSRFSGRGFETPHDFRPQSNYAPTNKCNTHASKSANSPSEINPVATAENITIIPIDLSDPQHREPDRPATGIHDPAQPDHLRSTGIISAGLSTFYQSQGPQIGELQKRDSRPPISNSGNQSTAGQITDIQSADARKTPQRIDKGEGPTGYATMAGMGLAGPNIDEQVDDTGNQKLTEHESTTTETIRVILERVGTALSAFARRAESTSPAIKSMHGLIISTHEGSENYANNDNRVTAQSTVIVGNQGSPCGVQTDGPEIDQINRAFDQALSAFSQALIALSPNHTEQINPANANLPGSSVFKKLTTPNIPTQNVGHQF